MVKYFSNLALVANYGQKSLNQLLNNIDKKISFYDNIYENLDKQNIPFQWKVSDM